MADERSRLQRGTIARLHGRPKHGLIVRGWIGATEIAFDARDLDGVGFEQLHVGQAVEFYLASSPTGLRATGVRIIDEQP
ncbi:MAG: cold shock domain-containing protein [Chloroflexi bacterium]|jgi:cold shock CspA family protein|nr:cold shock domain-containing protein [Chloroflexota bacterium]